MEGLVKRLVRLTFGWLLMLAGVLLMLDSALPAKSRGRTGDAVEALAGFALAGGGWCLRRAALRASLP